MLVTLGKPAICWNHGDKGRHTDAFLQSQLLLGVNVMIPFVDNDHSIHYPVDDSRYRAYGRLFAQLRSKQWVLAAHAVRVKGGKAQANLFHTKFGFAAPIVFPQANVTSVEVALRGVRKVTEDASGLTVSVLVPGAAAPAAQAYKLEGGTLTATVALAPCAMLIITDTRALAQPRARDYLPLAKFDDIEAITPSLYDPKLHICGASYFDPSAPLLRDDGTWHVFDDKAAHGPGWTHFTSTDLLHWTKLNASTGFGGMTGSIAVTESGAYSIYPWQRAKGVFNRSLSLDVGLTKWGPPTTVVPLAAGIVALQDPSRAVKLADGFYYVLGGCNVQGANFSAVCLFRATDSTLSVYVPADGKTGLFFNIPKTHGAIDGNGVWHNKSYALAGLDVGCPDLFPCGASGLYCMLITYGGPPKDGHMQEQWWSGRIVDHKFVVTETDLVDYGNMFAAKSGTVERQTGTSRRFLFAFPGWTQRTKPKGAISCLQFPRELGIGADNKMRTARRHRRTGRRRWSTRRTSQRSRRRAGF